MNIDISKLFDKYLTITTNDNTTIYIEKQPIYINDSSEYYGQRYIVTSDKLNKKNLYVLREIYSLDKKRLRYLYEKYTDVTLVNTIEKDENGDIIVVRANVVLINNLISDLTENIQREFDSLHNIKISLPLGSLTGIYFMSGFGPEISINVSVVGTVDTNIKSEFIAQGINQTLHRVYVNFDCEMKIVTPVNNFSQKVTNQVIIAEHVIVGNIPSSYYNLDGFENESDTMQIIK